jgi:hypothetical protein
MIKRTFALLFFPTIGYFADGWLGLIVGILASLLLSVFMHGAKRVREIEEHNKQIYRRKGMKL